VWAHSRGREQPRDEYADEEDTVTAQLPSIQDGQWLVQLAHDDVRVLSHGQLLAALRSGAVSAAAFVWRNGMSQWLAAGTLPDLTAALQPRGAQAAPWGPTPGAGRAPSLRTDEPGRASQGAPQDSLLAVGVVALVAILLVSWGLAAGGVFDDHGGTPASTQREP
jgi:hypothetical protein